MIQMNSRNRMFLMILEILFASIVNAYAADAPQILSARLDGRSLRIQLNQRITDLKASDFQLGVSANTDTLGINPLLSRNGNDWVLLLGKDASLTVNKTYSPGSVGKTPASIRLGDSVAYIDVDSQVSGVFQPALYEDTPELHAYFGQLHAHTNLSDGMGSPHEAFSDALRTGFDFYAITDHAEWLDASRYQMIKDEANRQDTPGHFVAFYGYEWSGYPETFTRWMNHLNVIGAEEVPTLFSHMQLDKVYNFMSHLPETAVTEFNHPGYHHYLQWTISNWHNFKYSAETDRTMKLIRIEEQGAPNSFKKGYIPALDQGWHLSPEADEDNHDRKWASGPQRTGVWSPELTRSAIMKSLRTMATFFTNDGNGRATLKLVADHRWLMGSTLRGPGAHHLEIQFHSSSEIARVEWISLHGAVIALDVTSIDVNPAVDTYYFAHVTDHAGHQSFSAPIYIDR